MTDIATDLKDRFYWAAICFFERHALLHGIDTATELPAKDAKAVELLEALRDSVHAMPPSLIVATEDLRNAGPDAFESWLVHGVQVVGFGYYPTSATEFLQALNNSVQRDMASA
jgi:hypothetical protein